MFSPKEIALKMLQKAGGLNVAVDFMFLELEVFLIVAVAIIILTLVSAGSLETGYVGLGLGLLVLAGVWAYGRGYFISQNAKEAAQKAAQSASSFGLV